MSEFLSQDQRILSGISVIFGSSSHLDKAKLLIQGDGWLIGRPNFQGKTADIFLLQSRHKGLHKALGHTTAAEVGMNS